MCFSMRSSTEQNCVGDSNEEGYTCSMVHGVWRVCNYSIAALRRMVSSSSSSCRPSAERGDCSM